MNMIHAEDIVTVTDFAQSTREHLAEMAKSHRPRVLTQDGKAAAVVVPVEMYDEMAHEAYERKMDLQLKASLEAYARGDRGTDGPTAFARMREKLGLTKSGK